MDTPGIKMLCPTRWTVQGESFARIKDNYEALGYLLGRKIGY